MALTMAVADLVGTISSLSWSFQEDSRISAVAVSRLLSLHLADGLVDAEKDLGAVLKELGGESGEVGGVDALTATEEVLEDETQEAGLEGGEDW